jgi:opacity protein-like surface antigen
LAVAQQMSIFVRGLGLTLVLTALCLGGRTAHAQATAVPYSMANWPIGFGGNLGDDVTSFDGDARDGVSRYNFPNGFFVGGGRSGMGFGMSSLNQASAFGNLSSLSYEGMKFGYDFKNAPLTLYGGLDTMKYNIGPGAGSPFAAFESTSGTVPGYSVNAGVEFRPTSNLSLSLGVGYLDQSTARVDSDIRSPLLPGQTPLAIGGRRY